jgi:hypothetical protein
MYMPTFDRNPFDTTAVQAIADYSRGVPRLVNSICFNAVTLAFAADKKTVTEREVTEVAGELVLRPSEVRTGVGGASAQNAIPTRKITTCSHPIAATMALLALPAVAAVLLILIVFTLLPSSVV